MSSVLLISPGRAVLSRLMAIIRKPAEPEGGLPLVFNNGDLASLRDTVERLGFRDEESLLRYVLAVLSQSATRTLTVTDKSGKSIALSPSETVLKPPAETAPTPPPPPAPAPPPQPASSSKG